MFKNLKKMQADGCSGNCSSCGEGGCADRTAESLLAPLNENSSVKKVIGVVSGKGGVGKSLVTSLLATNMQRKGYNTAVMDADITGPSVPRAFGTDRMTDATELGINPVETQTGLKTISVNNLLDNPTDPVVWRGPVIGGVVKQFWTDVAWGDVDYMFIDMPPGTGDVPLTVFQSIPVDGIVVVASPQELVGMIVEKALKMAEMMNIPVIGLVENMAYFKCPECGTEYPVFGPSKLEAVAENHGLKILGRIPIDPNLAASVDVGMVELYQGNWLDEATEVIEKL